MIVVASEEDLRRIVREELSRDRASDTKKDDIPEKEWISNPDFLKRYGVSTATAQRWRSEEKLPYTKIGQKLFYRIRDVEKLFEKKRRNKPLNQGRMKREAD